MYAKPSAIGGTLIRKVIAQFKKANLSPIGEPVLIATSGGVDSMVLAHLLGRYGRKIAKPEDITLLHFDHQWRKESSTAEKKAVKDLAYELGVGFKAITLDPPAKAHSRNLEEDARLKRKAAYEKLAGSRKAHRYVFTAHHQNDVAETLIWRFFRGEFLEQQEGILFNDGPVLRPFLQVSKEEIREYAKAEKVPFFEDPTNEDPNQMRAFLRHELIPMVEKRFPALRKVVAQYAEKSTRPLSEAENAAPSLESALVQAILDCKLNRYQRNQIQKMKMNAQLSLPGGRTLIRQKDGFLIKILDDSDRG